MAASANAADWTTFGFDNERTGFTALPDLDASELVHKWAYDLGGVVNAQPLYADGVVFGASEAGNVAAIDAVTGIPRWTRKVSTVDTLCADVPEGIHGVSATPVIGGETIWVAGGDGRVWAFDRATGKTRSGWPVKVGRKHEHVWGALALSKGTLYAATASHCDNAFYRGRLVALDPRSGKRQHQWLPVGKHAKGGGIWGWGGVVIDGGGDVYAATANAQVPKPENYRHAEHVVRLSSRLRVKASNYPGLPKMEDNDFGGSPILFRASGCPGQLAVIHKNGELLLYDRDRIRRGPRQRLQAGSQKAFIGLGTHAWSPLTRTLYLANGSRGKFAQGLVALRVTSTCKLKLAWQREMGPEQSYPTTPVVAGGVVLYGDGSGNRLHAFDAADGTPLWDSDEEMGALFGAPIVADGMVFAPSWDHKVHASRLDRLPRMALDTAFVGKTYDPFTMEVEADRIRQYAEAVHEKNPVHHDSDAAKEAGFRDVVAPPMFAVVYSAGAMGPPIFEVIGEALPRMVHGGQEFVWGEPVCAGDTITTESVVKEIYEKDGKGFYVFETVSKNQDGAEVVRATWTNIVRGV